MSIYIQHFYISDGLRMGRFRDHINLLISDPEKQNQLDIIFKTH